MQSDQGGHSEARHQLLITLVHGTWGRGFLPRRQCQNRRPLWFEEGSPFLARLSGLAKHAGAPLPVRGEHTLSLSHRRPMLVVSDAGSLGALRRGVDLTIGPWLEQFPRAGAKADAMKTIVLIRLGADRQEPMTVKDLTTGHTEVVPADPGVLAQLEHDVSEGYFEAILNGDGFSFGNRVPPPADD